MPPALGLFSTITGWPRISCNGCPTSRAARSVPPPAPKPTTILIVRVGQSCAWTSDGANADRARATSAMNARANVMAFLPYRCELRRDRRPSHLLIRVDHRLPIGAGLLQPVGGELLADLLEARFQR